MSKATLPKPIRQQLVPYVLPFASASATINVKHFVALAPIEILDVEIVDPTGLATSDVNYAVISLKINGVVAASYSTKTTGGQGALVANTPTPMILAAGDLRRGDTGAVISFDITITGTTTVPAGLIAVHARYRGTV